MPIVLLTYYCALILVASIVGGMIPIWIQLTHRRMELAISFVAGVMLGVAVLHMLPHALVGATAAATLASNADLVTADTGSHGPQFDAAFSTMLWLLAGMLAMFFIERFLCFHHHDAPDDSDEGAQAHCDHVPSDHSHAHSHPKHGHGHDATWSGAAIGMMLHSILDGVALAASVQHDSSAARLAGFGAFLVIVLHKPFDSMSIGLLLARGGWSMAWRLTVNALFALAIPLGVLIFYFGLMPDPAHAGSGVQQLFVAYALAFSAGTFMCISLSDLLPELQFHQHDRVKLSAALLLGLAVAYAAGKLEAFTHPAHTHAAMSVSSDGTR